MHDAKSRDHRSANTLKISDTASKAYSDIMHTHVALIRAAGGGLKKVPMQATTVMVGRESSLDTYATAAYTDTMNTDVCFDTQNLDMNRIICNASGEQT